MVFLNIYNSCNLFKLFGFQDIKPGNAFEDRNIIHFLFFHNFITSKLQIIQAFIIKTIMCYEDASPLFSNHILFSLYTTITPQFQLFDFLIKYRAK